MKYKTIIGLPAYNEEKSIGKLLDRITKLHDILEENLRIIIVNDGSSDRTEDILKEYTTKYSYISYINHSKNSDKYEVFILVAERFSSLLLPSSPKVLGDK